jgi:CBS domain containing-hemolysin-like protein
VKVRRTRLQELAENGSKSAEVALEVTSDLDAYLSATQLGITLASLGLGWAGEPAIASLIGPFFMSALGWNAMYTHTVAAIIAFIIITFLHIILGELVPKSIAIQKAEMTAIQTAGALKVFYKIFYPVIWTLNELANHVLKLLKIEAASEADIAHTEEELRMLVDASQKYGFLDKLEGKLLDNVFVFSDRVVSEVMVPRQDMVCMYIQDSVEEILQTIDEYGHTRYPLCDDDKDHVLGLVHLRDLFQTKEDLTKDALLALKRDILMVPEAMPISHLVQKMRNARTHMAVVVDEYGGTAGIATIEDLIEELVGEIYDEFEETTEIDIVKKDNYLLVNGRVLLEELEEIINLEFGDDTVSTIAGFVFNRLGRKPEIHDMISFEGYKFEVIEVQDLRIAKVKIEAISL